MSILNLLRTWRKKLNGSDNLLQFLLFVFVNLFKSADTQIPKAARWSSTPARPWAPSATLRLIFASTLTSSPQVSMKTRLNWLERELHWESNLLSLCSCKESKLIYRSCIQTNNGFELISTLVYYMVLISIS